MDIHRSKYRGTAIGLLALTGPAFAHGGLGSLGALHAALMIAIGVGGLVVIAFLVPAVRSGTRNDSVGIWAGIGLFIGIVYVFVTLSLVFTSPEFGYTKFPGIVAAVVLALLCTYFLRHRQQWRNVVLTAIGVVTTVLVLVPAGFWKGNPFDLVETVFVDNSAQLEALSWNGDRDSMRQLLPTADGREILQFVRGTGTGDVDELFGDLPGERVMLKPIDTGRTGEWYEVSHYVTDRRFASARNAAWNKPRHRLFTREVEMFRPNGQRSVGVVLDRSADIEFEAMLLGVLSRSGTRDLKRALINAGRINVRKQSFIDEAFKHRYGEAYRFLLSEGLRVSATNSAGESVLHRAADIADVRLMRDLVDRGADPSAENARGMTPFEVFLRKHGDRPIVMRPFREAFPEVSRNQG